jgi:hypothetical protein
MGWTGEPLGWAVVEDERRRRVVRGRSVGNCIFEGRNDEEDCEISGMV